MLARTTLVFGLMLALVACATETRPLQVETALQRPHSARLYFIRQSGLLGLHTMSAVPIKINGQDVGPLRGGSYLVVERQPGLHTLRVEPVLPPGHFETDVTLEPGRTYYFEIGPFHTPSRGVLLPVIAGNVGKPMEGRSFLAPLQINSLDAATGAAEIAKLRSKR